MTEGRTNTPQKAEGNYQSEVDWKAIGFLSERSYVEWLHYLKEKKEFQSPVGRILIADNQ